MTHRHYEGYDEDDGLIGDLRSLRYRNEITLQTIAAIGCAAVTYVGAIQYLSRPPALAIAACIATTYFVTAKRHLDLIWPITTD